MSPWVDILRELSHNGDMTSRTTAPAAITPEAVYCAAWDAAEATLIRMANNLGGKRAHASLAAAMVLAAHHGVRLADVKAEANEIVGLAAESIADRAALVRDYPDLFA